MHHAFFVNACNQQIPSTQQSVFYQQLQHDFMVEIILLLDQALEELSENKFTENPDL